MGWRRVLRGVGIALLWALVIIIGFALSHIFPNFREQLGITTSLVVIAIALFAYVTIVKDNVAGKIGETAYPSKKWIESIESGEPTTPVHAKSQGIPHDGWGVAAWDHLFYRDFAAFGRMLNEWLKNEPWRLQERAETELSGKFGLDSPSYGRRYDLFYNQQRLGRLEISAGFQYSHAEPRIHGELEVSNPRMISHHSIINLCQALRTFPP